MAIGKYEFSTSSWPPPSSRKEKGRYLFGFDEDQQPYVVKWDDHSDEWVACTLAMYQSGKNNAMPRHFVGDTVGKLIKNWADAPLLKETIKEEETKEHGKIYRYR